jgi:hypothetical protein
VRALTYIDSTKNEEIRPRIIQIIELTLEEIEEVMFKEETLSTRNNRIQLHKKREKKAEFLRT